MFCPNRNPLAQAAPIERREGRLPLAGFAWLMLVALGAMAWMALSAGPTLAQNEKKKADADDESTEKETTSDDEAEESTTEEETPAEAAPELLLVSDNPDPFDLMTITSERKPLKIKPLSFRALPKAKPKPAEKIVFFKYDNPTEELEINWRYVTKIEFFEDRMLAEARGTLDTGKVDDVYRYLEYLYKFYPKLVGLDVLHQDFLYKSARQAVEKGRYLSALGQSYDLHAMKPDYPDLAEVAGQAIEPLIAADGASPDPERLAAARKIVRELTARFPEHPVAAQWIDRWKNAAGEFVSQAAAQASQGNYREAQRIVSKALDVWPDSPDARQKAGEYYERHPFILVGVLNPYRGAGPSPLIDWSVRRVNRLQHRHFFEFAGAGAEGGRYVSPFGKMSVENIGERLVFKVNPDLRWPNDQAPLTSHDIARWLLSLANRKAVGGQPDWADLFARVNPVGPFELHIDLRRSHVRPESLLQTPFVRTNGLGTEAAPGEPPLPAMGGYTIASQQDDETVLSVRPDYFAARASQPREIVERHFVEGKEAVRALRRGEIRVLDRVNPWEVGSLRSAPGIVVEPYAMPTVHCLMANVKNKFTGMAIFRRAVLYGIDRQLILDNQVLRGKKVAGCNLLSGPFPEGGGAADQMRYASNPKVKVKAYDPRLAYLYVKLALKELKRVKGEELAEVPPLKLAYHDTELVRAACAAIKQHLEVVVQLKVELVPLPSGQPIPVDADYDLVYAELNVQEPLVDARRVLAADGLAKGCRPYMTLALKQLDASLGWRDVRDRLHQIHELAAEDLVVIPLWQIAEHYAYHESVQGLRPRSAVLYQQVEQWQCKYSITNEK